MSPPSNEKNEESTQNLLTDRFILWIHWTKCHIPSNSSEQLDKTSQLNWKTCETKIDRVQGAKTGQYAMLDSETSRVPRTNQEGRIPTEKTIQVGCWEVIEKIGCSGKGHPERQDDQFRRPSSFKTSKLVRKLISQLWWSAWNWKCFFEDLRLLSSSSLVIYHSMRERLQTTNFSTDSPQRKT